MVILMQSVVLGSYRVGITRSRPEMAHLVELADAALDRADRNKDSQVSFEEFTRWCRVNMETKELIHKFELAHEADEVVLTEMKKRARRSSRVTSAKGAGASSSAGVADAAAAGADAGSGGADAGVRGDGERIKQKRKPSLAETLTGSGVGNRATIEAQVRVSTAEKRTRLRKLQAISSHKVMADLADNTSFDRAQLRSLAQKFSSISDVAGNLDQEAFVEAITEFIPGVQVAGLSS